MALVQEKYASYDVEYYEETGAARVEPHPGFAKDGWDDLERLYRRKWAEGMYHWELDLRKLEAIDSLFFGLLIRLNILVSSRRGMLRLIVNGKSKTASLISLAKINRILPVKVM